MPGARLIEFMRRERARATGVIWIARAVIRVFSEDATRWFPLETGGVLLGYEDADTVVVRALVAAGPKARHAKWGFEPDARWQEREIARHYAESARIDGYVGEIHTHPRGGLRPSSRDRSTARRIARYEPARSPRPLMAIIGAGCGAWRMAAWRYERDRFTALDVRVYDEGESE